MDVQYTLLRVFTCTKNVRLQIAYPKLHYDVDNGRPTIVAIVRQQDIRSNLA